MEETRQAPDPGAEKPGEAALRTAFAEQIKSDARKAIVARAYKLDYKTVYSLTGDRPFILAGGAVCGDKVSDFDLYPVKGAEFELGAVELLVGGIGGKVLSSTRNALTVELPNRQVVQFCRYCKPTLQELVKSFDFAHIQAGITFAGHGQEPHSSDAYCTEAFLSAAVTGRTAYVGSEYPLSSAIRAGKYLARGRLNRAGAAKAMAKALADFLRRGFKDYVDFKDQLDAIDLSLEECSEASRLYDAVRERGLVANALG